MGREAEDQNKIFSVQGMQPQSHSDLTTRRPYMEPEVGEGRHRSYLGSLQTISYISKVYHYEKYLQIILLIIGFPLSLTSFCLACRREKEGKS